MHGGYELLKDTSELSSPVRKSNRRVVLGAVVASALLLSTIYAFSSPKLHLLEDDICLAQPTPVDVLSSKQPLAQCASSIPQPAQPPAPVNVWASLTVNETAEIADWLNHPSRGLNLTSIEVAQPNDNILFHIEAYRPGKSDALRYLESPNEDTIPTRYARVTIQFGARTTEEGGPVTKDYLVGPLPLGRGASMRELTEIYHREDIPFNARGFAIPTELSLLLTSYMPRLVEVTQVRKVLFVRTH
jgi:primary-amine oxidase